ncbi:MAG: oligosaccharide flippase family protein [Planctomycetes bacterium]|nr:oligosaccharide flippase family protein [Planctomycetota bacterium]
MAAARLPPWRGLLLLLCGEGLQRVLSFVAIGLLTRRLTRPAYAPIEVALAVLMFGALFVELGLPLLAAREVARAPGAARRLARPVVALQCAAAALLLVAAVVARAGGLLDRELAPLLPIYVASLLLLPALLPWLFQGLGAMSLVAAPGVVRQALFLLGVFVLVKGDGDVAVVPWIEVAAVGGAALLAQFAWRRRRQALAIEEGVAAAAAGGAAAAAPAPAELLREAAPMGLSQLLWSLRMFLATLLLWKLLPEGQRAQVADYGVAHRVMMLLQALLTMYFTNLYPTLARAVVRSREELGRLLRRSAALAAAAALLMAGSLASGAEPLLATLFGAELANPQSVRCLRLLLFVVPLLALRGHFRLTLLALGRGRGELAVSCAGTLLLAALLPSLTAAEGASGAALALLIAEAAGMVATAALFARAWRAPTAAVREEAA